MTDHSPTPWRIVEAKADKYEVQWILCGQGRWICHTENLGELPEVRKANAKHIVHCVNNHNALVNALYQANRLILKHAHYFSQDEQTYKEASTLQFDITKLLQREEE